MQKENSEFGKELEKISRDWVDKTPLGYIFAVDLFEYMAIRLKEKYEIKEK